jgi:tRNA A37 N6-isopentenylltransferase MiaA
LLNRKEEGHPWEALDAADPPDLVDLRERGVTGTRWLAKRQITWLRGMP